MPGETLHVFERNTLRQKIGDRGHLQRVRDSRSDSPASASRRFIIRQMLLIPMRLAEQGGGCVANFRNENKSGHDIVRDMPRKAKAPPAPFVCQLRHGVTFIVTSPWKSVSSLQICRFFGTAMQHFRSQPIEEFYRGGELVDRVGRSACTLSRQADSAGHFITADEWYKALTWAYCNADTIKANQRQP